MTFILKMCNYNTSLKLHISDITYVQILNRQKDGMKTSSVYLGQGHI